MFTKQKKGQLEIGITTMVLVVFIVLLLVSLVIYFRFTYAEFQETGEELLDQKYNGLLNVILGLPEFRCSRNGAEEECLDASKLDNFEKFVLKDNDAKNYYENLFGNVNAIWVDVLDAEKSGDYFRAEILEIYGDEDDRKSRGAIYGVPVSLYYPDYGKYKIGILKIKGEL